MRLKGFTKLTRVADAISLFSKAFQLKRGGAIEVSVGKAFGRVAADDIIAPVDLPLFNRSAVDGFALKAKDTFNASQFAPKIVKLTNGDIVGKGQGRQVWTGTPLPKGADAVVMLEYTHATQTGIEVIAPVTPGKNVLKRGEDVRKFETVAKSGTRLSMHHVGLLAALGFTQVNVVTQPKIAIISTGKELIQLGETPSKYQIIDSNRYIISGLCAELGAEPVPLGIVRDNQDEIASKILTGLKATDAVITTGGTSVGEADLVASAVSKLGKPGVVVHGLAMRPGMPTGLAVLKKKPVFMLSGYPIAATIGFEVFARPTILKLMGIEHEPRPMIKAKVTQRVVGALGRRVYLRVHAHIKNGNFYCEPIRTKGSGIISTMTKANGYVIIPEDREGLKESETVIVHLFGTLGG